MIVYDLRCTNGHSFEGWFEDLKAYRSQKRKAMIACPVCNDIDVHRIPSTFAIKSPSPDEKHHSEQAALALLGQKIAEFVEKNFDDVGCQFTTEALKMHYGVSEPRNIRGVSTQQEEKVLKEEGVEFFKLPVSIPPDSDDAG